MRCFVFLCCFVASVCAMSGGALREKNMLTYLIDNGYLQSRDLATQTCRQEPLRTEYCNTCKNNTNIMNTDYCKSSCGAVEKCVNDVDITITIKGLAETQLELSNWQIYADESKQDMLNSNVKHGLRALKGPIPTQLGMLTNLSYLRLGTTLSGEDVSVLGIPTELMMLTKLVKLQILKINFSTIPSFLPQLQLQRLEIVNCALSSTVPTAFMMLHILNLGFNKIFGTIPSLLSTWTNLTALHLENNKLSGTLPSQLGDLVALRFLNVASNKLTGVIPDSYSNYDMKLNLDLNKWNAGIYYQVHNTKFMYSDLVYSNNDICTPWTMYFASYYGFANQHYYVFEQQTKIVDYVEDPNALPLTLTYQMWTQDYVPCSIIPESEIKMAACNYESDQSENLAVRAQEWKVNFEHVLLQHLYEAEFITSTGCYTFEVGCVSRPIIQPLRDYGCDRELLITNLYRNFKTVEPLPDNVCAAFDLRNRDIIEQVDESFTLDVEQILLPQTAYIKHITLLADNSNSLRANIAGKKLPKAFHEKSMRSELPELIEITIRGFGVEGPLPGYLPENLVILDLSGNDFTGSIPDNYKDLKKLSKFDVSNNKRLLSLHVALPFPIYYDPKNVIVVEDKNMFCPTFVPISVHEMNIFVDSGYHGYANCVCRPGYYRKFCGPPCTLEASYANPCRPCGPGTSATVIRGEKSSISNSAVETRLFTRSAWYYPDDVKRGFRYWDKGADTGFFFVNIQVQFGDTGGWQNYIDALSSSSSNKCTDCKPGRFSPGYAATSCKDCEQGSFASKKGAKECLKCSEPNPDYRRPGYNELTGQSTCTECEIGKVLIEKVLQFQRCNSCEAGTFWSSQKRGKYDYDFEYPSCDFCDHTKGEVITQSREIVDFFQCKSCPVGKVIEFKANEIIAICWNRCKPCGEGKYWPDNTRNTGTDKCLDCPAGKYSTGDALFLM